MLPLAFALLASVQGGTALPPPAVTPSADLELASDPTPSANDGLWWRSAAVAGGTCCGSVLCGALPLSGGALLLSTVLRSADPVVGYAIGFCCGAALIPIPGLATALLVTVIAAATELMSGLDVGWGAIAWAAGVGAAVGVGLGAIAFVIAFPLGFALTESGARLAASVAYFTVPLVVVGAGSLVMSAAAGGLYFLARTEPDETVVDAAAWSAR